MNIPPTLGNQLHAQTWAAQCKLFRLGELAQFSFNSLDASATTASESETAEFEIQYPIGMNADGQPLLGTKKYSKEDYIRNYQDLAFNILPLQGIYQMVTSIELMLGDVTRCILSKFPEKISKKKNVSVSLVLGASSLEDIHSRVIGSYLNELNYKSPKDYADAVSEIYGFNILEIPCFHSYIEIKATRDIFIHNGGTANEIYRAKSGTHARVHADEHLPVTNQYFMHSLEHCLKFAEILEAKFHAIWESSDYIKRKTANQ